MEKRGDLPITFTVCDSATFVTRKKFHDALSVMVLPYAEDEAGLMTFFRSTKKSLLKNGRFISVVLNPNFTAFDRRVANRRFRRRGDGRVTVEFLDPQTMHKQFDAVLSQFSRKAYEYAATGGGFSSVTWHDLHPTSKSAGFLGKQFWKTCETEQPYALLIAR
jgi:hypothetical protein